MPIVRATNQAIADAAHLLRAGELVAFPTETVYGLGADATNGMAVARVFAAKGRPQFNPLIVHVPDDAAARAIGVLGAFGEALAEALWPGPLTLVVPRRPAAGISELATAGLDTVAIRVPSHPVAVALLRAAGVPVVAPSANRSGHVSATRAEHVAEDLGAGVARVLDDGASPGGIESTVVDVGGPRPRLLRPGAVTAERLAEVLGRPIDTGADDAARPSSPGQLASHYAPSAAVRLEARDVRPGEALLAFGPGVPAHDGAMVNLSASGDLVEAAANLFQALRRLDRMGARTIAVMPIPADGLGVAINDRLRRAAAPRG